MNEPEVFLELLVEDTGSIRHHYDLANLSWKVEEETRAINLIPIGRFQNRLIVAVPKDSWHRTIQERYLPKGALSKPILIEVATALHAEPTAPLDEKLKVWIGYLDPRLEAHLVPGRDLDIQLDVWFDDIQDGELRIPLAEALADAAEEHFGFQSATEHQTQTRGVEGRMQEIEKSLADVSRTLAQLVGPNVAEVGKGQPAPSSRGARPKRAPALKKKEEMLKIPGLDPSVVASAIEAGIPRDQLTKLGQLASKPGKMTDLPTSRPAARVNILDESEEEPGVEEEEEFIEAAEGAEEQPSGGPIEQAVVQLTKIVEKMVHKPQRDLEALLDGAEGTTADPTFGSGGKSKAAAYSKLRSSLEDNPSYIFKTVEALMDRDFQQVRAAPGSSEKPTGSRSWVEHRSRVLHYPSSVRAIWTIAGILDCLRQEARSRAALAVAAWDQASLDGGNWLMSQELLMEDPPPWTSFQQKRTPEPWEQAATKLADERWLAVLQWKLKDKDAYLETKKRLVQNRGRDPKKGEEERDQKGAKGAGKKGAGGKNNSLASNQNEQ